MKILVAGFDGHDNSAKILLDKLSLENIEKLYLLNDFEQCASQITRCIQKNKYEIIIAFGQKPLIKSVYIERYGCVGGHKYKTVFEYEFLKELLTDKGYKVKLSDNAGNYLCNHVYGTGLGYIEQHKLTAQYIFIHIPYIKNLVDINTLAGAIDEYIQCRAE
jgi:pyroglutamyl-peptidase